MIRPVVEYPDQVLRSASLRVEFFDNSLRCLVEDMFDTMASLGGVGLAAPQINVSSCVVVIDPSGGNDASLRTAIINPRITWRSKDLEVGNEGCLSIPDKVCKVQRHAAVEVEYQDVSGKTHTKTFTGFEARIVQHELDHLLGIVMTDMSTKSRKISITEREVTA